jgi:hypothetical protein
MYSTQRKQKKQIIVAHSTSCVLFAGSNSGNGFSSNADEIAVAAKRTLQTTYPYEEIILNGFTKCI